MVRGEVFLLPAPKAPRGHEQSGPRCGVVVRSDDLLALSTTLIAPRAQHRRNRTGARARPLSRPAARCETTHDAMFSF